MSNDAAFRRMDLDAQWGQRITKRGGADIWAGVSTPESRVAAVRAYIIAHNIGGKKFVAGSKETVQQAFERQYKQQLFETLEIAS